ESEQELNRTLARGNSHEYFVKAPLQVSVSYYRAGTEVFISGNLDTVARAACSRCAEEFDLRRNRHFRYVLAPKVTADNDDLALKAEDLEFSFYQGDEIDLGPLVREQALLAMAERPLCREECRGLCAQCGANLNEGNCSCSPRLLDPRLAVLRSLKVAQ
ncbi:MAG: DUF177 domain-containing protein, partial [Deltaproteobacteria bacterium]|nr:DUF177 domain-containing protein [Deltaproteobacteria bacterium]